MSRVNKIVIAVILLFATISITKPIYAGVYTDVTEVDDCVDYIIGDIKESSNKEQTRNQWIISLKNLGPINGNDKWNKKYLYVIKKIVEVEYDALYVENDYNGSLSAENQLAVRKEVYDWLAKQGKFYTSAVSINTAEQEVEEKDAIYYNMIKQKKDEIYAVYNPGYTSEEWKYRNHFWGNVLHQTIEEDIDNSTQELTPKEQIELEKEIAQELANMDNKTIAKKIKELEHRIIFLNNVSSTYKENGKSRKRLLDEANARKDAYSEELSRRGYQEDMNKIDEQINGRWRWNSSKSYKWRKHRYSRNYRPNTRSEFI